MHPRQPLVRRLIERLILPVDRSHGDKQVPERDDLGGRSERALDVRYAVPPSSVRRSTFRPPGTPCAGRRCSGSHPPTAGWGQDGPANGSLRFYAIDPATRQLTKVTAGGNLETGLAPHGFCMCPGARSRGGCQGPRPRGWVPGCPLRRCDGGLPTRQTGRNPRRSTSHAPSWAGPRRGPVRATGSLPRTGGSFAFGDALHGATLTAAGAPTVGVVR